MGYLRSGARYRIRAVAQMTGVPAATLRAWERRYGVPSPVRTQSAYRLYSDVDVAQVRTMKRLRGTGMPASEAARQVRGTDVVSGFTTPSADGIDAADTTDTTDTTGAIDALAVERLVNAVLAFDAENLGRRLRWAMTLADGASVYRRIISPALHRVGQLWEAGRLSVAQEHFFSHRIEHLLRDTLRLVSPPQPFACLLLACIEQESHTFGLYGVALHAARWGWAAEVLGGRTPPDALADAIAGLSPDIIGLSITLQLPPEELLAQLTDYRRISGSLPLVVGGIGIEGREELLRERGIIVADPQLLALRDALGR